MNRYVIEHRYIQYGRQYGQVIATYDSVAYSPREALDEAAATIHPGEETVLVLRRA